MKTGTIMHTAPRKDPWDLRDGEGSTRSILCRWAAPRRWRSSRPSGPRLSAGARRGDASSEASPSARPRRREFGDE